MAFEKPTWITKEFLQKTIQNGDDSIQVSVNSFDVDMPVPKGNNYGSDIYGVKAEFTKSNDLSNTHEISLIMKGQVSGYMSDMAIESGATDKEAMVYRKFAPKLELLFSGSNKSDEDEENNIFPKSYFSSEENVIIVEDLKCKGYQMADKLKRLDFDHCATALKALAKFHAGSIIIQEKEPELIQTLSKDITDSKPLQEWFTGAMKTTFKLVAEEFKKLPNLQRYSGWYEKNTERIGHLLIENMTKSKENEFKVLNHGDFSVTNMLFKTTANKPPKVKLIDFQCCRYTSPAVDFLQFMDGSAQEDVWRENFNDLINIYLNEFNSLLERQGNSKRLSEVEFKKSIADRPYYRLSLITFGLALALADPKEVKVLNREEFTQDVFLDIEKTPVKEYIKNKTYLEIMTKRLMNLENTGVISLQ